MDASINPQNKHGIMFEQDYVCCSDSSSSDISVASLTSSSDLTEDASSLASSSTSDQRASGPLYQMSSLVEQLPFKRGLSKHYQGKSQSFSCLLNVRSLEDLPKPENPYKKKLQSRKSYGGDLDMQRSKTITKKAARSSCSSLNAKKSGLLSNRPPISSHITSS